MAMGVGSLLAAALIGVSATIAAAQDDLKRLSIEELMRIDVTTTSRQPEPIGTTAAAISVITGDDIRRAGVTTIADALLLADGVHVARFNNGTWAISPRGFNSNTANKLLVMIDGRTVYSPLFSGVFWNMEDYVLGDIDRIEVIRGPGATLWGANAVNGVVNIITRHSRDTQGTLAVGGGGHARIRSSPKLDTAAPPTRRRGARTPRCRRATQQRLANGVAVWRRAPPRTDRVPDRWRRAVGLELAAEGRRVPQPRRSAGSAGRRVHRARPAGTLVGAGRRARASTSSRTTAANTAACRCS